VTPARSAVLTRDHGGRPACHYCGPCDRGCSTGSYFSTGSSTLPAARATGKLTLRANAVARRLLFDPKRGRLSGVAILDAATGRDEELSARVVFLCASTLESIRLLLNSADTRFPEGLANSSGMLGRNLMDHLCAGGAAGTLPELAKYADPGRRPSGVYVPRWVNRTTKEKDFVRGFGFQGESRRLGVGSLFQRPRLGPVGMPGFGSPLKAALSAGGAWSVSLSGFGECLPHPDNRATIDPALKDRFGIPALAISAGWGANERAMWPRMRAAAAELLEAAGVKDAELFGPDAPDVPGRAVHEMGGARMGDDPKTSVLDRWNRAHDVPNLFVTDGSCMASSGCVNPSLTYMAITARAASFAIEALKRRDL
jgi:choline dehydrogenase-like flavoprotein